MAFNPFMGMTEAELLPMLRELQRTYASSVQAAGSGSANVQNLTRWSELEHRIEHCFEALHLLNPTAYPVNRRESRTSSNYLVARY